MKQSNSGHEKKRGILARVFMAMMAMNAMGNDVKGGVKLDRSGGFFWGSADYAPRKHKSYIKQVKDARKRHNHRLRNK